MDEIEHSSIQHADRRICKHTGGVASSAACGAKLSGIRAGALLLTNHITNYEQANGQTNQQRHVDVTENGFI